MSPLVRLDSILITVGGLLYGVCVLGWIQVDDWLHGRIVASTKDLGLSAKYIAILEGIKQ